MSGWTVPLSSSSQAPSTPGSGQRSTNIFANLPNGFTKSPLAPNPSTTPAGPPPSSAASFTPADPPPSSIFASSQLGYGKTLFKSKSSHGANTGLRKGTKPLYTNTIDQKKLARFLNKSADFDFGSSTEDLTKNTFGVPSSSPPHGPPSDVEEESYEDESEVFDEEADAEGSEEEGTMNVDQGSISHLLDPGSVSNGSLKNGESVAFGSEFGSSIMDANPRGTKRTRGGSRISNALPRNTEKTSESHGESDISKIAKSTAGRFGIAKLRERDDFIVGTEAIIKQDLYGSELLGGGHHQPLHAGLPKASEALSNFWWSSSDQDLAGFPPKEETLKGIGPEESAPPVHKAIYLGALLLRLRHPPTAKGKQSLALARLTRSSLHRKPSTPEHTPPNPTAFPKVLLDWLNEYQDPYGLYSNDIESHQPNPTAHKDYWGILYSFTLRGRLSGVINLLKKSNFIHAKTAMEDRRDGQSYSVVQVRNIERVINRAIQVLEHCPASQEDDWNITGNEWIMFRKRVEQALTDLATFAEGRDREMDPTESTFEASNFGLRGTTMDLSQSARRAESRVPWTVYGNLRTIYGIILGRKEEILYMAQDWVEATIALTAWWTGDDDEDMHVKRVPLARQSLGKLESHGMRTVDVNPNAAYLRRLASALKRVNAEGSALAVNTMNPVEVGLASVFEGSIELVVGLLRAWSLPVASAVVEIASAGGWLETEARVLPGLDESDRRLLDSVGPSRKPLTMRDTVLTQYADALSHRGKMTAESISEGWEFSISVLNRLENQGFAMAEIKALLSRLPRGSSMQVDRILQTCERFAITKEARVIAEGYADTVVANTDDYGTALVYFARAHCQKKMKDVLDLLISLSLVQSTAYPALAALDSNLHSLIFEPQQSLGRLALFDQQAAKMLQTHLSGYATLRRFYDLRDEEVRLEEGQKPNLRPIARMNAAATALLAVINSAADNIHGGLYDENRGAVVQVDALLALLGEATMFVNQPSFLLSQPQCFSLIKAIEDLQTTAPRIYSQCEECFHATLVACKGRAAPPSPRQLLQKTMSSMSASSFSLLGESMSHSESSGLGSSRALAKSQEEEKRGWDWRRGLGENAKGEDMLRILRLGLAKDIAKHWISG